MYNTLGIDGSITSFNGEYRWLSNFWPCKVNAKGYTYSSVEHAYVAFKTDDKDAHASIVDMTPSQAKRFGRKLVLIDDWDNAKFRIMSNLVRQKFTDDHLAKLLLDTGDALIIEGNTWGDQYWGQSPIGKGKNYLGKIIMSVREELK